MARSSYVYVVMNGFREPVAGFTVKHELLTWLTDNRQDGYRVWRIRDGRFANTSPIDVTDKVAAFDF
jgi:hypothetical protein